MRAFPPRSFSGLPIWCCLANMLHAQVEMPMPLQLVGDSAAQRQVVGLDTPGQPSSGVSANTVRYQDVARGTTTGGNELVLTLVPTPAACTAGMRLTLVPSEVNTGGASLNVNGLGPYPLLKFTNVQLDSADLRPGIPVEVVFDGSSFQLVNGAHPSCPPGYFPISRDVCTQQVTNAPLNFYASNTYCANRNARLCTMAEWYRGCAMPGGFLPTMTELEWVDHSANNSNDAKNVGFDSVNQLLGCSYGGYSAPLGLFRFRCCYDR